VSFEQLRATAPDESEMSIEVAIRAKLRRLSAEQQQQVLAYVESLLASEERRPRANRVEGMWSRLGVDLTEADIDENRREMLRGGPREGVGRDE
jgi:hypothetical protein